MVKFECIYVVFPSMSDPLESRFGLAAKATYEDGRKFGRGTSFDHEPSADEAERAYEFLYSSLVSGVANG